MGLLDDLGEGPNHWTRREEYIIRSIGEENEIDEDVIPLDYGSRVGDYGGSKNLGPEFKGKFLVCLMHKMVVDKNGSGFILYGSPIGPSGEVEKEDFVLFSRN